MSKKKKFLAGVIFIAVLLMIQFYFLMSYDHFKAEGGLKMEMAMDHNDVTKEYTRASLDFDYVMEDAIRTHKSKGGDFLKIFAASNKKRLKKPLVHLLNYKEIEELSIDSKDDEVIEFLRGKLDQNLEFAADFYRNKIERSIDIAADVSFDSKELTMTIKIPGVKDSINPELFRLPHVDLGFYECATLTTFGMYWQNACHASQYEPVEGTEEELDVGISIVKVSEAKLRLRKENLANSVTWQGDGVGLVKSRNKSFVDSMIHTEEIAQLFPEDYRFAWSQKDWNTNGGGDIFYLHILRIPKNGKPVIGNEDIHSAEFEPNGDYGRPLLNISMTQDGASKWAKMTSENVNRAIAMCINGVVFSAPHVIAPITDGNTQITGSDHEELMDISIVLNARSIEIHPISSTDSYVKPNPTLFNATIQKILIVVSILLLAFCSIGFVRNLRTN